jgi:D-tyrosyl-tRNA(Tyr) deacylase
MIALIQRVKSAQVKTEHVIASIDAGMLLFLGIGSDDGERDIEYIANKSVNLRIFSDENGDLNRSLIDTGGDLLIVSQFTLMADLRKGRRPSFSAAAPPQIAEPLYRQTIGAFRRHGLRVAEGSFGAYMQVGLVNDGPVTIIIDSKAKRLS